ncbi:Calmodulin-like protein [Mycena sanguinolenta]|uniref:Calmodulin-like protein n=1 Tax=Mycena sanguinolenta TaxID=230812 RepID=A0A8H7DL90_9AGAR|nr:Calmodulin-like protein [Mycena sanguinolenta]
MSTSTQTQSRTSSNVADIDGVHPSAVGANTQPDATKTQPTNEPEQTNKENVEGDHLDSTYPEQKHAGAVGYGPNYRQGAGLADKITGIKEQVKGKITRDPALAEKGHDRMTGELKRKELEEDAKADPFANPEEKKVEQEADATNGTPNETTTTDGTSEINTKA